MALNFGNALLKIADMMLHIAETILQDIERLVIECLTSYTVSCQRRIITLQIAAMI
jgi:hypothetical protein